MGLPELAQDKRKRIIPRRQLMNLHTDDHEPVVDQLAVSKVGLIALSGFLNLMGESLSVAVAGLEIGLSGLGVGESGHDGVSLQRD